MATISILEAQAKLSELNHAFRPGVEVIITENSQPIARLQAAQIQPRQTRRPGTLRGTVLRMAPDFDAPLDDFKEYIE